MARFDGQGRPGADSLTGDFYLVLVTWERTNGPLRQSGLMRLIFVGAVTLCSLGVTACSGTRVPTSAPTSTTTSTSLPLPAGWKTVTYHGVGIDVPSDWLVEPWRLTCGVTTPTVFIGPAQPLATDCVANPPAGAEVILGALGTSGSQSVSRDLNGIMAEVATQYEVYHGNLGATITDIWVSLPTENVNISVSVGDSARIPGGAPGRAEQIVQTIRPVSDHV